MAQLCGWSDGSPILAEDSVGPGAPNPDWPEFVPEVSTPPTNQDGENPPLWPADLTIVPRLLTSRLYPLDIVDGLGTAFRLPSSLSTFRQPVDSLGTAFRLSASGDLRQTYFPHNVDVNETQFLGTSFRLPPVGNLGPTYFPRYVDVRETQHLGTTFRLPSSGNLGLGILANVDDSLNTPFRLPSSGDLS